MSKQDTTGLSASGVVRVIFSNSCCMQKKRFTEAADIIGALFAISGFINKVRARLVSLIFSHESINVHCLGAVNYHIARAQLI